MYTCKHSLAHWPDTDIFTNFDPDTLEIFICLYHKLILGAFWAKLLRGKWGNLSHCHTWWQMSWITVIECIYFLNSVKHIARIESTDALKMTTISNISDVLGDHMLKGWVRAYANLKCRFLITFARSSQISLVPLQDVLSLLCGLRRVELPLLRFAQVAVKNHTYYYLNHSWYT